MQLNSLMLSCTFMLYYMYPQKKFGMNFTAFQRKRLHFVPIYTRFLLEPKWYPVFTMLGQSLGSVVVALEGIARAAPEIYCDTMGAAFPYPLVKLLCSAKTIAYVHYPVISSVSLA